MSDYSLRKNRRILRAGFKLFQKKKHILTESEQAHFESELRALDHAVLTNNKTSATLHAKKSKFL